MRNTYTPAASVPNWISRLSPRSAYSLLPVSNEAEDVCVYPMEDGSLFHVVDYDKLINANVSHYKPAEG